MKPVFYLVRHAEAERGAASDGERGLTPAGRAAFEALARELGSAGMTRILVSPYLRARQTAEILAAATGAEVQVDVVLAPGRCTGPEMLALGRAVGGGVALVGHNPEMAEAVILAAGGDRAVPPGAVAAVEAAPECRLAWLRVP